MTEHGNEISDVTVEQVRDHLAEETDPKSIERLTAARESLAGPIQFLQALQSRFGEEIVVLDTGSYFTANKVREFVEGTERATLSPDRNGEARSNRGVLATAENSTREQILRFA